MEGHGVEASGGEKGPMQRGTVRGLKTAAAAIEPHGLFAGCPAKVMGKAAAATQPRGLFAGYPAKGEADQEAAASAAGSAFALAAVATAMAQQAMEAAQRAAVLAAAASKQAEEASQADAFNQEDEEEEDEETAGTDAFATDSEDEDEGDGMTSMDYIMTYKELPPFEVELILQRPVVRMDFAGSEVFKAMKADPYVTQDDIDKALEEHNERQDTRIRFHDWVRSEYETKGYVAVSEEYIARRTHIEEFSSKLWEEGFAHSVNEDED